MVVRHSEAFVQIGGTPGGGATATKLLVRAGLIRDFESNLLEIPVKVIVGDRYRETGRVELEIRDGKTTVLASEDVLRQLELR